MERTLLQLYMLISPIIWQGEPMSGSSITDPGILRDNLSLGTVPTSLVHSIKRLAFWSAIVLPFLHLSLLASGLDSPSMGLAFVVLVALNVVALLIGHTYGRE